MPRSRLVPAPLAALGLAVSGGCFSEPPPSLRSQMIEQEIAVDTLEKALESGADPAVLKAEAERITAVSRDEAFERFRQRSAVKPRLADFDAFRAKYVELSEDLEAAAVAEDVARVTALVAELRASCDACHAVFRPGL